MTTTVKTTRDGLVVRHAHGVKALYYLCQWNDTYQIAAKPGGPWEPINKALVHRDVLRAVVAQRQAAKVAPTPGFTLAWAAFKAMMNKPVVLARLSYLWGRWQDEQEYEEWNDYHAEFEKLCAAEGVLIKLVRSTRRPFAMHMTHASCANAIFILTVTSRNVKLAVQQGSARRAA